MQPTIEQLQRENETLKLQLDSFSRIQQSFESKLRWIDELRSSNDTASASQTTGDILSVMMQSMMGNFGAMCAAALSLNPRPGTIVFHKCMGINDDDVKEIGKILGSSAVIPRLIKPVSVDDPVPDGESMPQLRSFRIALVIPFPADRTSIGLILLGRRLNGHDYLPEDKNLIALLAANLTLSLKNRNLTEKFLTDQAEKFRIRGLLEQFVAPEIVEDMISGKVELQMKGERRRVSVVMADIRDFTAITEQVDAELIVMMLNQFYKKMSDIVFDQKGIVDKFIGDAVLAVFGASSPGNDDAAQALHAAFAMVKAYDELIREHSDFQNIFAKLGLGVGVTTGEVILGNMGSGKRIDHTMIGKKVNLAARLSSVARPNEILVDEATYLATKSFCQFETLKPMIIKGIDGFVTVYKAMEIG